MDKNISDRIIDRIKREMNLDSNVNESGNILIESITEQLCRPIIDEKDKITKILLEVANEFRLNPRDFAHSFDEKTNMIIINYEKNR